MSHDFQARKVFRHLYKTMGNIINSKKMQHYFLHLFLI